MPRKHFLLTVTFLFCIYYANADSVIKGKIDNFDDGEVAFQYQEHIVGNSNYFKIPLEKGAFEYHFDLQEPAEIEIWFKNNIVTVFLLPGDEVSFECDFNDVYKTLSFTGTHNDDHQFLSALSEQQSIMMKTFSKYENKEKGYMEVPDDVAENTRKNQSENIAKIKKEASGKYHFSNQFKAYYFDPSYEKAAAELNSYRWQRATIAGMKLKVDEEDKVTEEDIEKVLSNLKIENEADLASKHYIDFLNYYDSYLANSQPKEKIKPSDPDEYYFQKKLTRRDNTFKNKNILYALWVHDLAERSNHADAASFANEVAVITKKFPDGKYNDKLNKLVAGKKKLLKGAPAPPFKLEDINGNTVALENLKGKVLYIEFWASWCLPCVIEMKKAKAIKEHYKNEKDLLFVYITKEENKTYWKNAIKEHDVQGLNLFAGKSAVVDEYQANGVPHFAIIDRDGTIVTSDAPRPSESDQLMDVLDKTLDQY